VQLGGLCGLLSDFDHPVRSVLCGALRVDGAHARMSSRRARRRRACGHKQRHTTQGDAIRHARHLMLQFGGHYLPYRCSFCGQWHVGRPNRRIEQAIAARRAAHA
jgi:hypothetical protein